MGRHGFCFALFFLELNWRAETRFAWSFPWEVLCAVLSQAGRPVSTFLRNRVKSAPPGCLRGVCCHVQVCPGLWDSCLPADADSHLSDNWISRPSSFLWPTEYPPRGQGGWIRTSPGRYPVSLLKPCFGGRKGTVGSCCFLLVSSPAPLLPL